MELKINLNKEVLSKLELYLSSLKSQWDAQNPKSSSWLSLNKSYILNCTVFLVSMLDDLIVFVQAHIQKGSDKKAVVLSMSADVFDHIAVQAFPVWLKPFAPVIKEIVVSIVISQLVEFIVSKYKEGVWRVTDDPSPPDEIQKSMVYKSKKEKKWKK